MKIKELINLFGEDSQVNDLNITQATPSEKFPNKYQIKFVVDKEDYKTHQKYCQPTKKENE
jgi:hypothetical protein